MTAAPETEAGTRRWWTRPAVVLSFIGAVVVFVAIRTPEPSQTGRMGDARLSSHLSGSQGARLLLDLAGRLGWHVVVRDSSPVPTSAPGTTIHAVLAPPLRLTRAQAHLYLEAVRRGDALLIVLDERDPLADSLEVRHTPVGGVLNVVGADSASCRSHDRTPALWPDGQAHLYGVRIMSGQPQERVVFASVSSARGKVTEDAAIGFALGRGRVVVVADPDLLRTDVLRRCEWGADVIACVCSSGSVTAHRARARRWRSTNIIRAMGRDIRRPPRWGAFSPDIRLGERFSRSRSERCCCSSPWRRARCRRCSG